MMSKENCSPSNKEEEESKTSSKRVRFNLNHEINILEDKEAGHVECEEEEEKVSSKVGGGHLVPYHVPRLEVEGLDKEDKCEMERELWSKLGNIWEAMAELKKCDNDQLDWIMSQAKIHLEKAAASRCDYADEEFEVKISILRRAVDRQGGQLREMELELRRIQEGFEKVASIAKKMQTQRTNLEKLDVVKSTRYTTKHRDSSSAPESNTEDPAEQEDSDRAIYQEFYLKQGARPKVNTKKKNKKTNKNKDSGAFKDDGNDGYITDTDEEWGVKSYAYFRAEEGIVERANAIWAVGLEEYTKKIPRPAPPPYVPPPPPPLPPLPPVPPNPAPAKNMVIETPDTPVAYGKIVKLCLKCCCPAEEEKLEKWKFE